MGQMTVNIFLTRTVFSLTLYFYLNSRYVNVEATTFVTKFEETIFFLNEGGLDSLVRQHMRPLWLKEIVQRGTNITEVRKGYVLAQHSIDIEKYSTHARFIS
jgi:formylmethanofuran dehydrogenase subunit E-like metal-binding protein